MGIKKKTNFERGKLDGFHNDSFAKSSNQRIQGFLVQRKPLHQHLHTFTGVALHRFLKMSFYHWEKMNSFPKLALTSVLDSLTVLA